MHLLTRLLMVLLISTFMLEIGLSATGEVRRKARRVESAVGRGLVLMLVLSPLLALAVVWLFRLERPVAPALLVLSVTGLLPLASRQAHREGGELLPSAVLLALALGVVTIFTGPPSARLLLSYTGTVAMPTGRLVAQFILLQGVPIALGVVLQKATDRGAEIRKVVHRINTIVMALVVLLVVVPNLSSLAHIGWAGAVATIVFSVALWLLANAIGGPEQEDRRALAVLANAPNVVLALAIARAGQAPRALTVVILGVFLLRMLVGVALRQLVGRRHRPLRPAVPAPV